MRWTMMAAWASGCLWIDDDEHARRKGTTDPSPTGTTPVEMDLSLDEPRSVDACEDVLTFTGTVDAAWAERTVDGSLSVPGILIPFETRIGPTDGLRAPFAVDLDPSGLADCEAPCRGTFSLGPDATPVDLVIWPVAPEVGITVGGAALGLEVTLADTAAVEVTVDDPRADALGLALVLCPSGTGADDPACVALSAASAVDGDLLTGTLSLGVLREALCEAQAGVPSLWARLEGHSCDPDPVWLGTPTWWEDCDNDQLPAAAGDCDDFDAARGNVELPCDGVDNDCDDQTATLQVGGVDQPDIATAIGVASAATPVTLCDGDFVESVVVEGVDVYVTGSQARWTGAGGAALSVSGTASGGPPTLAEVVLSGLTLGGTGDQGGAVFAKWADLTLTDVVVTGGEATLGGGLFLEASQAELVRTSITGNTATAEGGGIALQASQLTLDAASTVSGNTATGRGGGLMVAKSIVDGSGTVTGNHASEGGGAWLVGVPDMPADLYPELGGLTFVDNTGDEGPELFVDDLAILTGTQLDGPTPAASGAVVVQGVLEATDMVLAVGVQVKTGGELQAKNPVLDGMPPLSGENGGGNMPPTPAGGDHCWSLHDDGTFTSDLTCSSTCLTRNTP